MPEAPERVQRLLKQLETEREELKLKLGLAKLEARDEWEELEDKLDALRGRMKVVGEEAKEASSDVVEAASLLASEIKEGFARIRKRI